MALPICKTTRQQPPPQSAFQRRLGAQLKGHAFTTMCTPHPVASTKPDSPTPAMLPFTTAIALAARCSLLTAPFLVASSLLRRRQWQRRLTVHTSDYTMIPSLAALCTVACAICCCHSPRGYNGDGRLKQDEAAAQPTRTVSRLGSPVRHGAIFCTRLRTHLGLPPAVVDDDGNKRPADLYAMRSSDRLHCALLVYTRAPSLQRLVGRLFRSSL